MNSHQVASYENIGTGNFPLAMELPEKIKIEVHSTYFNDPETGSKYAVETEESAVTSDYLKLQSTFNDSEHKLHLDSFQTNKRKQNRKSRRKKSHGHKKVNSTPLEGNCKCSLHCFEKFTENDKLEIFSSLVAYKTKNEQDRYLQDLIQTQNIMRRRPRSAHPRPRAINFRYSVIANHRRIPVCRNAFMVLYKVTSSRVRRLCCLLYLGLPPVDLRGRHKKTPDFIGHLVEDSLSFQEGEKSIEYSGNTELEEGMLMTKETEEELETNFKQNWFHPVKGNCNGDLNADEDRWLCEIPKTETILKGKCTQIVDSNPAEVEMCLIKNDTLQQNRHYYENSEVDLYQENMNSVWNTYSDTVVSKAVEVMNKKHKVQKRRKRRKRKQKQTSSWSQGQNCSCSLQCFKKITEEEQIEIYNNLIAFETKDEQDMYLQGLIQTWHIQRKRPRSSDPRPRTTNFRYYVIAYNRKVSVCKKAFLLLHGISEGRVRRLCCLLYLGLPPIDMRGRSKNHHELVTDFISDSISNGGCYSGPSGQLREGELYEMHVKEEPESEVEANVESDMIVPINPGSVDSADIQADRLWLQSIKTENCPEQTINAKKSDYLNLNDQKIRQCSNYIENSISKKELKIETEALPCVNLNESITQRNFQCSKISDTNITGIQKELNDIEIERIPHTYLNENTNQENRQCSNNSGTNIIEKQLKTEIELLPYINSNENIIQKNKCCKILDASVTKKELKIDVKPFSVYQRGELEIAEVENIQSPTMKANYWASQTEIDDCKCSMNCYKKITKEEKVSIFNTVLSYETKNEQDMYLQNLIEAQNILRKRPRSLDPKPRCSNFKYYAIAYDRKVCVCKKAFVSLHGITESRVRRLCCLLYLGVIPIDKRGKNSPSNKVPDSTRELIRCHIESFPVMQEYSAGVLYNCLDKNLDVRKMHIMFLECHPNVSVSYSFYMKFFKENFSLTFGKPCKNK